MNRIQAIGGAVAAAEPCLTLSVIGRDKDRRLIVAATPAAGGETFQRSFWPREREELREYLEAVCEQFPGIGPEEKADLRRQLNRHAKAHRVDIVVHPPHGPINGSARCSIDYYSGGKLAWSTSGNLLSAKFRADVAAHVARLELGKQAKQKAIDALTAEINASLIEQIERLRSGLPIAQQSAEIVNEHCPYYDDGRGILMRTKDGAMRLANFSARIVAEVLRDDGSGDLAREFELEVKTRTGTRPLYLGTDVFQEMTWPLNRLGTQGHVRRGQGIKESVRDAIVMLSGEPPEKRVHTCPGWIVEDGRWYYLHGGGAIGAEPDVPESIHVELDAGVANYELPQPPTDRLALRAALAASLRILELSRHDIVYPVYCLIGRAPLGFVNFILNLVGRTGNKKSEVVSLAARHFGATMHSKNLAILWESTTNALGEFLFLARDTLGVIDDLKLKGSATDIARIHAKADTVFRWQGNGVGKGRMNASGGLRAAHPPRGAILSSSELIPNGESCRGRGAHVSIAPGDIPSEKLTACQRDAEEGLYAVAMSGYVRWLAQDNRIDTIRKAMPELVRKYRARAASSDLHARTPEIVADLYIGLRYWLAYCVDVGAISGEREREMKAQAWEALGRMAQQQLQHQAPSEPAARFIELVMATLASGKAYLANAEGKAPPDEIAIACGWWRRVDGAPWEPRGRDCIGYVTFEGVFLIPDAAYAAACGAAGRDATDFVEPELELRNRLFEKDMLAGCEGGKFRRRTVRRVMAGMKRPVLWLKPEVLEIPYPLSGARPARPEAEEPPLEDESFDFCSETGVDDAN